MSIHYRPMRPQDVRECVAIIAAHPIVGRRHGNAISDLGPAWLRLLTLNGFCSAVVFEEMTGDRSRIVGLGITVCASDKFVREAKTPPFFWIAPELAKRLVTGGDSPLLSPKQFREANSRGGLNLIVWQASVRVEDSTRAEVWNALMAAFLAEHRGFLLKELIAQGESPEHLEGLRNTGGFLIKCPNSCYGEFKGIDLRDLVREPHIAGLTRELATKQLGSWIGSLFVYQAPRFGFSNSEQRLLLTALAGGTDADLSNELGISLSALKKTWRSIYDRVTQCSPELIPGNAHPDSAAFERGREKKQHLLAYLRAHFEELRPVSRKLLPQNAIPNRASRRAAPAH